MDTEMDSSKDGLVKNDEQFEITDLLNGQNTHCAIAHPSNICDSVETPFDNLHLDDNDNSLEVGEIDNDSIKRALRKPYRHKTHTLFWEMSQRNHTRPTLRTSISLCHLTENPRKKQTNTCSFCLCTKGKLIKPWCPFCADSPEDNLPMLSITVPSHTYPDIRHDGFMKKSFSLTSVLDDTSEIDIRSVSDSNYSASDNAVGITTKDHHKKTKSSVINVSFNHPEEDVVVHHYNNQYVSQDIQLSTSSSEDSHEFVDKKEIIENEQIYTTTTDSIDTMTTSFSDESDSVYQKTSLNNDVSLPIIFRSFINHFGSGSNSILSTYIIRYLDLVDLGRLAITCKLGLEIAKKYRWLKRTVWRLGVPPSLRPRFWMDICAHIDLLQKDVVNELSAMFQPWLNESDDIFSNTPSTTNNSFIFSKEINKCPTVQKQDSAKLNSTITSCNSMFSEYTFVSGKSSSEELTSNFGFNINSHLSNSRYIPIKPNSYNTVYKNNRSVSPCIARMNGHVVFRESFSQFFKKWHATRFTTQSQEEQSSNNNYLGTHLNGGCFLQLYRDPFWHISSFNRHGTISRVFLNQEINQSDSFDLFHSDIEWKQFITDSLHSHDDTDIGISIFEYLTDDRYVFLSEVKKDEIYRDISRTFPSSALFRRKDGLGQRWVFDIIKALVCLESKTGYCQGMNFVVAGLLVHLRCPIAAFWMTLAILRHYHYQHIYSPLVPQVPLRLFQFNELVRIKLPSLWTHLNSHGLGVEFFFHQWLMSLFAYFVNFDISGIIWDVFFISGWEAIFKVGLGLLFGMQHDILNANYDTILQVVQSSRRSLCNQNDVVKKRHNSTKQQHAQRSCCEINNLNSQEQSNDSHIIKTSSSVPLLSVCSTEAEINLLKNKNLTGRNCVKQNEEDHNYTNNIPQLSSLCKKLLDRSRHFKVATKDLEGLEIRFQHYKLQTFINRISPESILPQHLTQLQQFPSLSQSKIKQNLFNENDMYEDEKLNPHDKPASVILSEDIPTGISDQVKSSNSFERIKVKEGQNIGFGMTAAMAWNFSKKAVGAFERFSHQNHPVQDGSTLLVNPSTLEVPLKQLEPSIYDSNIKDTTSSSLKIHQDIIPNKDQKISPNQSLDQSAVFCRSGTFEEIAEPLRGIIFPIDFESLEPSLSRLNDIIETLRRHSTTKLSNGIKENVLQDTIPDVNRIGKTNSFTNPTKITGPLNCRENQFSNVLSQPYQSFFQSQLLPTTGFLSRMYSSVSAFNNRTSEQETKNVFLSQSVMENETNDIQYQENINKIVDPKNPSDAGLKNMLLPINMATKSSESQTQVSKTTLDHDHVSNDKTYLTTSSTEKLNSSLMSQNDSPNNLPPILLTRTLVFISLRENTARNLPLEGCSSIWNALREKQQQLESLDPDANIPLSYDRDETKTTGLLNTIGGSSNEIERQNKDFNHNDFPNTIKSNQEKYLVNSSVQRIRTFYKNKEISTISQDMPLKDTLRHLTEDLRLTLVGLAYPERIPLSWQDGHRSMDRKFFWDNKNSKHVSTIRRKRNIFDLSLGLWGVSLMGPAVSSLNYPSEVKITKQRTLEPDFPAQRVSVWTPAARQYEGYTVCFLESILNIHKKLTQLGKETELRLKELRLKLPVILKQIKLIDRDKIDLLSRIEKISGTRQTLLQRKINETSSLSEILRRKAAVHRHEQSMKRSSITVSQSIPQKYTSSVVNSTSVSEQYPEITNSEPQSTLNDIEQPLMHTVLDNTDLGKNKQSNRIQHPSRTGISTKRDSNVNKLKGFGKSTTKTGMMTSWVTSLFGSNHPEDKYSSPGLFNTETHVTDSCKSLNYIDQSDKIGASFNNQSDNDDIEESVCQNNSSHVSKDKQFFKRKNDQIINDEKDNIMMYNIGIDHNHCVEQSQQQSNNSHQYNQLNKYDDPPTHIPSHLEILSPMLYNPPPTDTHVNHFKHFSLQNKEYSTNHIDNIQAKPVIIPSQMISLNLLPPNEFHNSLVMTIKEIEPSAMMTTETKELHISSDNDNVNLKESIQPECQSTDINSLPISNVLNSKYSMSSVSQKLLSNRIAKVAEVERLYDKTNAKYQALITRLNQKDNELKTQHEIKTALIDSYYTFLASQREQKHTIIESLIQTDSLWCPRLPSSRIKQMIDHQSQLLDTSMFYDECLQYHVHDINTADSTTLLFRTDKSDHCLRQESNESTDIHIFLDFEDSLNFSDCPFLINELYDYLNRV